MPIRNIFLCMMIIKTPAEKQMVCYSDLSVCHGQIDFFLAKFSSNMSGYISQFMFPLMRSCSSAVCTEAAHVMMLLSPHSVLLYSIFVSSDQSPLVPKSSDFYKG